MRSDFREESREIFPDIGLDKGTCVSLKYLETVSENLSEIQHLFLFQ